jgi:biopolymer transport protein TolR
MPSQRLSAAQVARIRRLSQPRELAPDEEGGELNIVPFLDIIMNILIFVLATVAVTFTATIETSPPASGGGVRTSVESKALGLTVLIVDDGFSIKASGGNVGPGCEGLAGGLALPKRGPDYDFAGLSACAVKLKASSPDFADETQVSIAANNDVPYQTVVSAIDAVRTSPRGEPLFPDVNFKVQR